jgi:hypothetical protein
VKIKYFLKIGADQTLETPLSDQDHIVKATVKVIVVKDAASGLGCGDLRPPGSGIEDLSFISSCMSSTG